MKIFAYVFAAVIAVAGFTQIAQADENLSVVHGTVARVDHANNRVYVRGDDGRDYAVDISHGHATGDARTVGHEVTVFGKRTGDNRIEASNITADRDYRNASASDRTRYRPSGWDQVHGRVEDIDAGRSIMRLKADDGQIVRVNLSALPDRREELVTHLRPGAVVTVIGAGEARGDRFMARHIRFDDRDLNRRAWGSTDRNDRSDRNDRNDRNPSGEVTIHGKVEAIHKDTMHVRTSDGRLVVVDIDPLREGQRERFAVGNTVTVVGSYKPGGKENQMTARSVRRDGGSSVAPSTPSGEQQVRGTIESIHHDNLRLKADDGRMIRVNIDPVRDNVRDRIKTGQRVTVVGVYTDRAANPNVMTARTVRVDENASASPVTNRPRNADDCKDKGWSNYSNPSFKNQGDCVSSVNSRK